MTVYFSIKETNYVSVDVNIFKKLIILLEVFCSFLTVYGQSKRYALFCYNRIQRNIRKVNQSFGPGNRINFIFDLETSFEMSEGRLNVSCFSERQIMLKQRHSSAQFIKHQVKLPLLCIKLDFLLVTN